MTPAERKALRQLAPAARTAYERGGNIGLLRHRMRLNQVEFGQLFGVHSVTVSKWERRELTPDPWRLRMLEAVARCPDDALVYYADRLIVDGPIVTIFRMLRAALDEKGASA